MALNTAPAYVKWDLMGVANSVKKDVLFIMILRSPMTNAAVWWICLISWGLGGYF
jgi:hypothetical protein